MTNLPTWMREVEQRIEPKESQQSNESLTALVNDVGLITNPNLRIAASVASDLLKMRTDLPKALAIIREMREALEYYRQAYCGICGADGDLDKDLGKRAQKAIAKADEIAGGCVDG